MSEELRDPHKAVDYIIENAGRFATAKGRRVHCEEFRKSKKAILMGQSDAKTVADREAFAYSHPDYIEILDGLEVAVVEEENLKWLLRAAELRVEIWRTQSANNRMQDRSTQ